MPLVNFRCPDNELINKSECVTQCRMQSRCLTRSTLRVIAEDSSHEWDGVPHVTQLLNGTLMEYLRITREYSIRPKDRAFALLGSSHHKLLDDGEEGTPRERLLAGTISELHLNVGYVQGTLDLLERDDGELVLTDYKTWGSNRLARDMGYKQVFDPIKTPPDLAEVSMQMNCYRVMVREIYDWSVDRMQVQCTVRDGGLAIATKRGVKDSMYLIPVPMVDDGMVEMFFKAKSMMLVEALKHSDVLPEPCTPAETWNGNRCRAYCDVVEFCPVGISYL